jgi:fatty-acyl-CoA synthase
MLGLMQQHEMTVDGFLSHAERWHGSTEVVSRSPAGTVERSNYATVARHARQISSALLAAGMRPGDRIATLSSNTVLHLECWYGIVGIGCICHTLDPRMISDQLGYVIDHAEDRLVFVERQYIARLAAVRGCLSSVERIVVVDALPGEVLPHAEHLQGIEGKETFVRLGNADCSWGGFDEQWACGLCYTSGTTGRPRGVLYSHRSNYLHALTSLQPDVLGLSAADVVLPIVPMSHANAWGIVHAAPAVGAKLALPGSQLDCASLFELMEGEAVTLAAGVPAAWLALLEYLRMNGRRPSTLKRILAGESATPTSLIGRFKDEYGIEVAPWCGMTKQGRCPIGLQMEVKDEAGRPLAHDGQTPGRLMARGGTVATGYYRQTELDVLDEDGFFDTGDIATIDAQGHIRIADREPQHPACSADCSAK